MVQLAADYERQKVQLGQSLRAQLADAVTEQNGLRRCVCVCLDRGRRCVCVRACARKLTASRLPLL